MASVTVYRLGIDLSDKAGVAAAFAREHPVVEIPLLVGVPGRLFVSRSAPRVPEWVGYLQQITRAPLGLTPAETAGAVLLLQPGPQRKTTYAVVWGTGRFLLNPERIQPDVGLRTAMNLLAERGARPAQWDPERVRSVRTKRVGQTTLISQVQASRKASIETFPFSVSADQLRHVTGSPVDPEQWGSTISGGDSLHVSRPEDARKLLELCERIEAASRSKDYLAHFAWIDNVRPVYDERLLERAVGELVRRLRSGDTDAVSVAPPSIIDWDAFAAFQYQWGRQKGETSDPSVETFLDFVGGHGLLEMLAPADLTAAVKLHALDDDGERIGSWPLLRCFTAEIELSGTAYILDEGALFAVDGTYLDGLNSFIGGLPPLATSLPVTKTGEQEGPYNTRLASQLKDALLLDKKTVIRRQATAIEICDVAFKSRKLVHVKKGLSSSSLSHLFAQGVISAELLHMDEEFRAAVKQRLSGKLEGSAARARAGFAWLYESPFQTMRCEVAYVVMAGAKAKTRRKAPGLPFFSKVNLRQRCEELRRMGFAHSLTLVPHA